VFCKSAFLNKIAEEIDARGDEITTVGSVETGLPEARLTGERGRTVGQLRLFATHIENGDYLDLRRDGALPDRTPLPRSDLKLAQRPVGPVAVFGASNFPLAFSTAGGDTASALAAGCPVIVKGHSAHPGTGELVAQAIDAAIRALGLHPGVFSFVQGGSRQVGSSLVQHPLVKAVGFTGSLVGGRALFDLCAARPDPIPFFGELGSVNPMFMLPTALSARGEALAKAWAESMTMGAGQFCTNPGIAVVMTGDAGDTFEAATSQALSDMGAQTMLTQGIASAYKKGVAEFGSATSVTCLHGTTSTGRDANPNLYSVSAKDWIANETLQEEVFGPAALVVRVSSEDEMLDVARKLKGQLTATMHLDDGDYDLAQKLVPILEHKAGRLVVNGFPTGVEVCDAMVHGGPYPASTNFGATSVGTMAIRRFLRPVCYQDFPDALLPSF
jgi:NADP-dependent aldehyde dehydrogenase